MDIKLKNAYRVSSWKVSYSDPAGIEVISPTNEMKGDICMQCFDAFL